MAHSVLHPRLFLGGLTALLVLPWSGLSAQAQIPEQTPGQTPGQTPETPPDTTSTEPAETDPTASDGPRFSCQMENGQYTVMYAPSSQPGQAYPWAVPQDMGAAWPADRRCAEIGARLESYRPDGLLALETSVENGYNTVCATTETVPGCRIVFTVPPGQDATQTRDRVFDNLAIADQGSQTQGVNTFADGGGSALGALGNILGWPSATPSGPSQSISLKPFLDRADGGTGANLSGGEPAGRPLNPDSFR